MNDILNSIKANLYTKAVSPLFGYYFFAWIGWNYKFILAIFSDLELDAKIKYIETHIFPSEWWLHVIEVFGYPLLTAIAAIYILPFFSLTVYKFHKKYQQKHIEVKQDIEKSIRLTIEQSMQIRNELSTLRSNFKDEIEDKDLTIEQLKTQLQEEQEKSEVLLSAEEVDVLQKQIEDYQHEQTMLSDQNSVLEQDLQAKDAEIHKLKEQLAEQQLEHPKDTIGEKMKQVLTLFVDNKNIEINSFGAKIKEIYNIKTDMMLQHTIRELVSENIIKEFKNMYDVRRRYYTRTEKAKHLMVEHGIAN